MTTALRPASTHTARYTAPAPGTLRPTSDRRWLITVGHPYLEEAAFATTVVGTLEQAQNTAGEKAEGRAVWVRDVMGGDVHHRAAGGGWVVGEGA